MSTRIFGKTSVKMGKLQAYREHVNWKYPLGVDVMDDEINALKEKLGRLIKNLSSIKTAFCSLRTRFGWRFREAGASRTLRSQAGA
ncbi:MAG: hypothetical protein IT426_04715 [Pirellulales bacterium]|nr:hypothetical protein [Pirellulales bacterium]